MVNKSLALRQGLSEEEIEDIDFIHEKLNECITENCTKPFNQDIYNDIEESEFHLQKLWGFTQNPDYHTWKNEYKFKCDWVGRVFQCTETGKKFTIPTLVEEKDFYNIGNGYLDVGVLEGYSRWSGVKEIIE